MQVEGVRYLGRLQNTVSSGFSSNTAFGISTSTLWSASVFSRQAMRQYQFD